MPLPGGAADKFGNRYEGRWTVACMLDVMDERADSIRLEPPGTEGEGAEFVVLKGEVREYYQAKRQHVSGHWTISELERGSILHHFAEKLKDPTVHCVFVSGNAAFQLDELSERAKGAASWEEFDTVFLHADEKRKNFQQLCRCFGDIPETEVFVYLKRIWVETISETLLRSTVESRISALVEGDAAIVADVLAKMGLELVHHELTANDIWKHLEKGGFRRRHWDQDPHVLAGVKEVNARYVNMLRAQAIRGDILPRNEAPSVLNLLKSPSSRVGVLLTGQAGVGKSGVMLQVVEALLTSGIPILAFREDRLLPTQLPDDVGKQLGLPGSPANVLAAVASGGYCVLLIDQMDALSLASGRNTEVFDCVEEIIRQAQAHHNMRILLACRKFDLDNDHRLRHLTGPNGIAETVIVERLSEQTVRGVVSDMGLDATHLNARQLDLLSVPLHLKLLSEISEDATVDALSFETVQDLYDRFWKYKQQVLEHERLHRPAQWTKVIYALCDYMHQHQRLTSPEVIVEEWGIDADAMASENVLVRDGHQFAFFHEGFFDYCYARRFAGNGQNLLDLLLSDEQHLFRRAQIRQILLYLREVHFDRYVADLGAVLSSTDIRFHLKQVVFASLAGLSDPMEQEWDVLAQFVRVDVSDPMRGHLGGLLRGSTCWFQLEDSLGLVQQWLEDSDDILVDQVMWLLLGVQRQIPDRVAELVDSYVSKSELWNSRLLHLAVWADLSRGRQFLELFLRLIDEGVLDGARGPGVFAREVLPFMLEVLEGTASPRSDGVWVDPVWQYRFSQGGHRIEDGLLHAMEVALSELPTKHPDLIRPLLKPMRESKFETVQYLMLRCFASNGASFADETVDFLCEKPERLMMGYIEDPYRVSRQLIESISPCCSDQKHRQLEEFLPGYYPAWERSKQGRREFGYAQFVLLSGIAAARRSAKVNGRLNELQRKFGKLEPEPPTFSKTGAVGSPIPDRAASKMTDEQWLGAISQYNSNEGMHERDGRFVGGARQLAQMLEGQVRQEPKRFAQLVLNFPDDTNPDYFKAVFRGLADADLDQGAVLAVCHRCHRIPGRPLGHWNCQPIANLAEESLPLDALDIVAWYATEDADPDKPWGPEDSGKAILTQGINTVRGKAAEAIAKLIHHDRNRVSYLQYYLEKMVQDPSTAVRSCVAQALLAVLRHERDLAVTLFQRLCDSDDQLLQTHYVERFLYFALQTNLHALTQVLSRMVNSGIPEVAATGARQACLAALDLEEAQPMAKLCLSGTEAQRIGAAQVMAANVKTATYRSFCEEALIKLFNDAAEDVRVAASDCFRQFEGDQLGRYDSLIGKFVESKAFPDNYHQLLRPMEQTTAKIPAVILSACERFINIAGPEAADIRTRQAGEVNSVIQLIMRVYQQNSEKGVQARSLDLIDRLMELGVYGINEAMENFER